MTFRIPLLVAICSSSGPCQSQPPDVPCECVFEYTVSGDGVNAVVKAKNGAVQSKDADNEIVADSCREAGAIKLDVTHTNPGVQLYVPTVGGCIKSAVASKNRATVTLAVGADCQLPWELIPTTPPVILPIKVRP